MFCNSSGNFFHSVLAWSSKFPHHSSGCCRGGQDTPQIQVFGKGNPKGVVLYSTEMAHTVHVECVQDIRTSYRTRPLTNERYFEYLTLPHTPGVRAGQGRGKWCLQGNLYSPPEEGEEGEPCPTASEGQPVNYDYTITNCMHQEARSPLFTYFFKDYLSVPVLRVPWKPAYVRSRHTATLIRYVMSWCLWLSLFFEAAVQQSLSLQHNSSTGGCAHFMLSKKQQLTTLSMSVLQSLHEQQYSLYSCCVILSQIWPLSRDCNTQQLLSTGSTTWVSPKFVMSWGDQHWVTG